MTGAPCSLSPAMPPHVYLRLYVKTEQQRGPQLEDSAALLLQVDGAAT